MHPVIWKEHDNSWTWSIEEGKAFEKGHQVLARDEGFATRGDAKEAMQKAWVRLIDEGKKPGRPGSMTGTQRTDQDNTPVKSVDGKKEQAVKTAEAELEWAVVRDDKIIAVFATQSQAKKFGRADHKGKYKVRRVMCVISN